MAERVFSWGQVPTSNLLPNGTYDFLIEKCDEAYTDNSECLMYVLEVQVVAPKEQSGKKHTEYMMFGKRPFDTNDDRDDDWSEYAALDDPEAEDPLTWRFSQGMRTFKKVAMACGVDLETAEEIEMDEILQSMNTGRTMFTARVYTDSKNPPFERNRFAECHKYGELTAKVEAKKPARQRGVQRATNSQAPARAPRQTRRRIAEEDDD